MTHDLETGDAEPITKGLLEDVVKTLVHKHGYFVVTSLKDAVGTFAFKMRDQYGGRFYLIAKGSKLFKGLVSCQAFIPNRARDEKAALILAWMNPDSEELAFYIFDPVQILEHNEGINIHRGVQFINWQLSLGKRFYETMDVALALTKMRGTSDV